MIITILSFAATAVIFLFAALTATWIGVALRILITELSKEEGK